MATAFTHAFVGIAAGKMCFGKPMPMRFWFLSMVCSALPDADVALHALGIAYEDLWGHRGMMHSLLFAAVVAMVVTTAAFRRMAPIGTGRWWGLLAYFFVVTASHGLIDMLTNGGLGIALFSPFENSRWFFPWRPLVVPYLGIRAQFQPRTIQVLVSEFLYVWLPFAGLTATVLAARASLARRSVQTQL